MKKIAIIGGGISGLAISHCLNDVYEVKVFEQSSKPGGLIKCERIEGSLYHPVGGHVFNSKRNDVLDWFWKFFNKEEEFTKTIRNAVIYLGKPIGYPIENHIYELDDNIIKSCITDLISIAKSGNKESSNFEEFLKYKFGETLYELYFKPYNEKIWKKNLKNVPLSWLEGKLPMPTVQEIIFNNFHREKEMNMVHSSFFYPKQNGSQFLADRLAENLDISYEEEVIDITRLNEVEKWIINGHYLCDYVIFAGNVKKLPEITRMSLSFGELEKEIENLEYHGTTSVLCKIETNPYSWIYLPDKRHSSHRIICTGNFAESNNKNGIHTGTIEFTDYIDKESIIDNLSKIPYSPQYITHRYTQYTYPIQNSSTRDIIMKVKNLLEPNGIYLLGRFAEWEYYNMDAAMGAAIDLSKRINTKLQGF